MATLTIQNVPENLVERIRSAADHNRRSMEQELRALIEEGRTGQKVVTFDGGMLLKFPEWTISVSDFIASSRDTL